ncbi:MAG: hypothetical protein ACOYMB_03375 [Patescibacteria group bacterium]
MSENSFLNELTTILPKDYLEPKEGVHRNELLIDKLNTPEKIVFTALGRRTEELAKAWEKLANEFEGTESEWNKIETFPNEEILFLSKRIADFYNLLSSMLEKRLKISLDKVNVRKGFLIVKEKGPSETNIRYNLAKQIGYNLGLDAKN